MMSATRLSPISRRSFRSPLAAALLVGAALFAAPDLSAQIRTQTIRGATRDSASGAPAAGALVELRGTTVVQSMRSDDAGLFRFYSVPAGEYRLTVLRIGFAENTRTLRIADRDTSVSVALTPIPRRIGAAEIRANVPAIYGTLGGLPSLNPVAGAKVQVLGAGGNVVTDSTGTFFIEVPKAGMYFVRVVTPGFAEERFPVEVPKDRAIDASRILDPSAVQPHPAMEHLYRELDRRIEQRGMNSAMVPGSEIRAAGATLYDALQAARSTVLRGMRLGNGVCLFVNGIQKPGWMLTSINVDDIEFVEMYGPNGNLTGTLTQTAGVECSRGQRPTSGYQASVAGGGNMVRTVSIWLRK